MSATMPTEVIEDWARERQYEHDERLRTDPDYEREYRESIAFDDYRADQEISAIEAHVREVEASGGVCLDPDCFHNQPIAEFADDDIPF